MRCRATAGSVSAAEGRAPSPRSALVSAERGSTRSICSGRWLRRAARRTPSPAPSTSARSGRSASAASVCPTTSSPPMCSGVGAVHSPPVARPCPRGVLARKTIPSASRSCHSIERLAPDSTEVRRSAGRSSARQGENNSGAKEGEGSRRTAPASAASTTPRGAAGRRSAGTGIAPASTSRMPMRTARSAGIHAVSAPATSPRPRAASCPQRRRPPRAIPTGTATPTRNPSSTAVGPRASAGASAPSSATEARARGATRCHPPSPTAATTGRHHSGPSWERPAAAIAIAIAARSGACSGRGPTTRCSSAWSGTSASPIPAKIPREGRWIDEEREGRGAGGRSEPGQGEAGESGRGEGEQRRGSGTGEEGEKARSSPREGGEGAEEEPEGGGRQAGERSEQRRGGDPPEPAWEQRREQDEERQQGRAEAGAGAAAGDADADSDADEEQAPVGGDRGGGRGPAAELGCAAGEGGGPAEPGEAGGGTVDRGRQVWDPWLLERRADGHSRAVGTGWWRRGATLTPSNGLWDTSPCEECGNRRRCRPHRPLAVGTSFTPEQTSERSWASLGRSQPSGST